MFTKKKYGFALLAFAAMVSLCVVQFAVIPARQAKRAEYARRQTDALTHDIAAIEAYRSAYVGNANNVSGLFENLPLNHVARSYEINSNDCALTVNYLDTVWHIGEEKVRRDLLYNAVAAMAAIDNLSEMTVHFSGDSFSFSRDDLEAVWGSPLSQLLEQNLWRQFVQEKLCDQAFVGQFFPSADGALS